MLLEIDKQARGKEINLHLIWLESQTIFQSQTTLIRMVGIYFREGNPKTEMDLDETELNN